MEKIQLNNGLKCPVIGIGTFMLAPADAQNSVREALKMGYRLVDIQKIHVVHTKAFQCLIHSIFILILGCP